MDLFYRDPGTWYREPSLVEWWNADRAYSPLTHRWVLMSPNGFELRHATMLEF